MMIMGLFLLIGASRDKDKVQNIVQKPRPQKQLHSREQDELVHLQAEIVKAQEEKRVDGERHAQVLAVPQAATKKQEAEVERLCKQLEYYNNF